MNNNNNTINNDISGNDVNFDISNNNNDISNINDVNISNDKIEISNNNNTLGKDESDI